jgi:diguanylate cyclase
MPTSRDLPLVALSILIAISASYVALDLTGRTAAARGRTRQIWMGLGALAMGVGIWSMHYIGMLAFRVWDRYTVALSIIVAVAVSAAAIGFAFRLRGETREVAPSKGMAAAH